MRIKKSLFNLGLGLIGGCVAFVGIESLRPEKSTIATQLEVVSPATARQVSYTEPATALPVDGFGNVDLRYAAKKTVPAVVHVKTVQMGREYVGNPLLDFFYGNSPQTREVPQRMGYGSGVIISSDGYIITNNHVIDRSSSIKITLDNKKEYDAVVVGTDPNTDIALLKIEETNLPYLEYADSDEVELGDWVLAVGNPYNLTSTVTAGIISAKARRIGINRTEMSLESFLQTDAVVNPGNSGGALVNTRGELIGINTAIESPTGSYTGYSFAVPSNIAKKVVTDLKEFGTVQRAVMGIVMSELNTGLAKQKNITEVTGIYIEEVSPQGAASKAGLKKGDIIKNLNGVEINTAPAFQGQLGKYHPGEKVTLSILRDGKLKDVDVVLQNMDVITGGSSFEMHGATFEPLTKEELQRTRLRGGLKITDIKNGAFRNIGLNKGYVVVKVGDTFIRSKNDLENALKVAEEEGVLVTAITPQGRVAYFALSFNN